MENETVVEKKKRRKCLRAVDSDGNFIYNVDLLCKKLSSYTKNTELPFLLEFTNINNLTRKHLYKLAKDNPKLEHEITLLKEKSEFMTDKLALKGKIKENFAIFRLKQFGWRDRPEEINNSFVPSINIILPNKLQESSEEENIDMAELKKHGY